MGPGFESRRAHQYIRYESRSFVLQGCGFLCGATHKLNYYGDIIGIMSDQNSGHASELWQRAYEQECKRLLEAYLEGRLKTVEGLQARARTKADAVLRRGTDESWDNIRLRILSRDGPRCQVCQEEVSPEHSECGHIVDRVCGGTDLDDNLLVMCNVCNRAKPLHETRDEFDAWVKAGYWVTDIAAIFSRDKK